MSAYSKPGFDFALVRQIAVEALNEGKEKKLEVLDLTLINQSDTKGYILANGKCALCNPGEKLSVKGLGVDLLLGECMKNQEAKTANSYFFRPALLRSLVDRYKEVDYRFQHPENSGWFYNFNFSSPTKEVTSVILTLRKEPYTPVSVPRA